MGSACTVDGSACACDFLLADVCVNDVILIVWLNINLGR